MINTNHYKFGKLRIKTGKMPEESPGLLALSVTSDCNLRCSYCYARGGESSASMGWVLPSGPSKML